MAVDLNYGVGVEGKNLVLKTLGRVYVKVKDRKYELLFRPEDYQELFKEYSGEESESTENISKGVVFINNALDLETIKYPGDEILVVTRDGSFFYSVNNQYFQIPINFTGSDLTVDNLSVNNQITFLGNNIPLILNNTNLIPNLNADLLDGYHSTSFPIKDNTEYITGQWEFSNLIQFTNAVGQGVLQDSLGQNILIDFTTGKITCDTIECNNLVNNSEDTSDSTIVSGIGSEAWVGSQVDVISVREIFQIPESNKFGLVSDAYNDGYLPYTLDNETTFKLTDWYNIFFSSYNEDTATYTLKDYTNPTVIESINNTLAPNYTINDFILLFWALDDPDLSKFNGSMIQLEIPEDVSLQLVMPNMIIKDNLGNKGVVLDRSVSSVYVQMYKTDYFEGNKLINIGNACQPGGILFKAIDPSLSILKDCLDETSAAVYFGNLSKIDNTKSGIGMILSGTYPDSLVADNNLDNIKNYQHTAEVNIDNPYIKWGDHVITLNEDGSGLLSHGQIRWSSNNDLVVDGSDIINSRIDNTGITNSSFQSGSVIINTDGSGSIGDKIEFDTTTITKNTPMGPAGGDLSGDYPNPTIKDGVITSSKLANDAVTTDKIVNGAVTEAKLDPTIITRISNIESDLETVKTDIDTVKTSIETIETDVADIKEQLASIDETIQEQLEPLVQDVEDLKTTVSEQGDSISSLSTSLTDLNNTVTSHGQSITNINESITTLTDSIDGVDTDLTALTTRVATLESTVGTLNTMLENRLNGN